LGKLPLLNNIKISQGYLTVDRPQIFVDKPYYLKAKYVTIGLWTASIVVLVIMYFLNAWENKRRDRDAGTQNGGAISGLEFLDLTDKENKTFRYVV
jgi:ACS family allantoate permease-like MFS transporter